MFTNPFFSKFFELGQVINTERGGGVFQPAIDQAVKLLEQGEWVRRREIELTADSHFPRGQGESRGVQSAWGVVAAQMGRVGRGNVAADKRGRIIMDSRVMPEIIPMWIDGGPKSDRSDCRV